jgi:hypothetical protein
MLPPKSNTCSFSTMDHTDLLTLVSFSLKTKCSSDYKLRVATSLDSMVLLSMLIFDLLLLFDEPFISSICKDTIALLLQS